MNTPRPAWSRPARRRRASPGRLAAAAACALALTACGTGTPGVAARVGDARITDAQVDDYARVLCAVSTNPDAPEETPTARLRQEALGILLRAELSEDVADVDAVDPDSVRSAVAQNAAFRERVPEDLRETFDDLLMDLVVDQLAIVELGRDSLAEQGQPAEAITDEAAFAEGERLRQEHARSADVTVDPRFGRMVDGALEPPTGTLSVPVSELAVQAGSDEPAEAMTGALPASQKCG